jgi:hypothetical protein
VKNVIVDDKNCDSLLWLIFVFYVPNRGGSGFDGIRDKVRLCSFECSFYMGYSRSDILSWVLVLSTALHFVGSLMWGSYSDFCE